MKNLLPSSGYYSFALRFTLCSMLYVLSILSTSFATIRYVSHSGSNTPPYTSWETAADSIQKCIDYSFAGDTIIVANGTYYESLVVDKYLSLIGSSMDSTIIDGTGLANYTVDFQADGNINLITIKGKGEFTTGTRCIHALEKNIFVNYCKCLNSDGGISVVFSSSIINQCIITNVVEGFGTYCAIDTCNSVIKNSIIITNEQQDARGIYISGGNNSSLDNIVIVNPAAISTVAGIGIDYYVLKNVIKNNIVSGYSIGINGSALDTAIVLDNIAVNDKERGITINSKSYIRNNISAHNNLGLGYPSIAHSDYNLYWGNNTNVSGELAEHDIVANPMFIKDTIPVYGGSYDYHLQAYSPAIDSGDPNILDVDGTRSDIGAYGGPLGESYKYPDLAPRPPVNLSGHYDSLGVSVKWNRNTEADFNRYNIYRDTIPDFPVDSTTFILSLTDTTYTHIVQPGVRAYYYKITAVDNQGNESLPSEELTVMITGVINNEQFTINNYKLFQNYPNPFNPTTTIGYRLKERGYVKLMVYDIKGEMIDVLVNKVQEAGYYEAEFPSRNLIHQIQLASGIYLYRIEVIGKGNIPVYSDMKKMILLK